MTEDSSELEGAELSSSGAEEALCQPNFPVIGIGASAGGLGALKELLQAMPAESGIALVIIQHLDPSHESQMASLLARYVGCPRGGSREGLAPEPNTVYTIPPGQYLGLREGIFHLEAPVKEHGLRMPIDFFFRSLAEARRGEGDLGGPLGQRFGWDAGGAADPRRRRDGHRPGPGHRGIRFHAPQRHRHGPGGPGASGRGDAGGDPAVRARLLLSRARSPRAKKPSPRLMGSDEILRLLLKAKTDFRGYKRDTLLRRV